MLVNYYHLSSLSDNISQQLNILEELFAEA